MTRRLLALLLALLLGVTLAACGEDGGESEGGDEAASGLDSLSVEGDVGSEPKVEFDGKLDVDEVTSDVVTEGDGETLESGDAVLAHVWIGNGFTQEKAFSTYDGNQPQVLAVDEKQLSALFLAGLEGQSVGSRVVVAASAQTAFGESGNPQLGIGNKDSVVAVMDLVSQVPDGPQGEEQPAPAWAPSLEGEESAPTGLDFSGTPKPGGQLRQAVLVAGEGDAVQKGQTVVVDYLGQVHGAKQPFDESYSAQPTSFAIGVGQVVKGWDQALVGQNVGSRVMLAIPPELGYGKQGNEGAGIKGSDTLYFVVDILAVA